ncbi:MAG: hypothetical protein UT63_C0066G0019 [Candidatus Gottesmanbacteria bacterium GW2011_GWC2_39_8]|uniref:HTH merR-type domain-containing protein n=1 Tax=Candidatus Gottesmanbacteria bacterium GW2011_GWC2_39_8 TaxID=1618450 RepID=A0A0G0PUI0_9BACT|nr:MAG: hypothetical protein UT63_C0066G0019 [Candidatus Gottesmanbacteria bacterium GW2011_GWC2_39_8]
MNKLIPISEAARRLGVSIDTLRRWDSAGQLSSVRSGPRGHRFYNLSDIEQFTKDQYSIAKKWVESSFAVEPESYMYCQTRDVFQARLESFQAKLSMEMSISTTSLITAVSGEIGNNSFDHNLGNWPDVTGIIFSYSLRKRIVVLADRGQGILKTLKRVKPELVDFQGALKTAFTETISGRLPEARGNGLKFVKEVIVKNPFTLYFQTGDAYLYLKQYDKEVEVKQANTFIRGCFAQISFEGGI